MIFEQFDIADDVAQGALPLQQIPASRRMDCLRWVADQLSDELKRLFPESSGVRHSTEWQDWPGRWGPTKMFSAYVWGKRSQNFYVYVEPRPNAEKCQAVRISVRAEDWPSIAGAIGFSLTLFSWLAFFIFLIWQDGPMDWSGTFWMFLTWVAPTFLAWFGLAAYGVNLFVVPGLRSGESQIRQVVKRVMDEAIRNFARGH